MAPAPIELRPALAHRLGLGVAAMPVGLVAAAVSVPLAVPVALATAAAWIAMGRRRLQVDADGVRWRGLGGWRALAWDRVDHYTYWSAAPFGRWSGVGVERLVDAPDAPISSTRHHLVLVGDGERVVIDSAFRGVERAVGAALAALHARMRTQPRDFAPFAIEPDGLRHAGAGVLPWSQLEAVAINAQLPPRLRVKKAGKASAWAVERMDEVHNGMLLLEELAERGVAVDVGVKLLVTAPLLASIRRQRALPPGRIVKG